MTSNTTSWNDAYINILQRIRMNAVQLNKKHTQRYVYFNSIAKYFDIPIIVLSVFSSSFTALGVIEPKYATVITTSISMIITILSSIKIYLNLSSNINDEISLSKGYYILSINIYKTINLRPNDLDIKTYIETTYNEYCKLMEQSSVLYKNIHKDLLTINDYFDDSLNTPTGSKQGSSNGSFSSSSDEESKIDVIRRSGSTHI